MEIIIHGRHLNTTEAIKNHVEKKASKLTKYNNRINKIQFTLKIEGKNHTVESICSVAKTTLVAEAANADMYTAIDLVMDKLEKQFLKHKEKISHHKRNKRNERSEVKEVSEDEVNEGIE